MAWLYALLLLFGAIPAPAPSTTTLRPPGASPASDLARMAVAVEGAESSFGNNRLMWRPNPAGPQGPMQISAAAAADVGDGNRFDLTDNRRLGQAYLALLYKRYGSWPDAVMAYCWGLGNVDRWVAAGRPGGMLSGSLQAYVDQVMRYFGGAPAAPEPPHTVAAIVLPPPDPVVDIRNPALRKKYLANRDAIALLVEYRDAKEPGASDADPNAIIELIRRVATRPGYEQFTAFRDRRLSRIPPPVALKQIAAVMIDKLTAETAAIVLVNQYRGPVRPR